MKHAAVTFPALGLVLACLAFGEAFAQPPGKAEPVKVPVVAPRTEDVSTLDGIVRAYYDVISGPAGKRRDWARDRTLYIPDVRLVDLKRDPRGRPLPHVRSPQAFAEAVDAYLFEHGFYETEIHRLTRRFGDMAHVWSTYECREKPDGPITGRGINSLELFWDGTRWWIASASWTDERPDLPLPAEYLPK